MNDFKHIRRVPQSLPNELAGQLRRFHLCVKRWNAARDLSMLVAMVVTFIGICCLFDRLVDVEDAWRVPLPWIVLILGHVSAIVIARRLLRSPDYDQVALTMDRRSGDSRDSLRSVLDFSRRNLTTGLARLSAAGAAEEWKGKSFNPTEEIRRASRWLAAAIVVATIATIAWNIPVVRAPLLLKRFVKPMGNHMRPTASWFSVEAPPAEPLRSGDDLTISMRMAGRPIQDPVPLLKVTRPDGSSVTRKLTRNDADDWTVTLNNVQHDFGWYLFMGPIRSRRYASSVLPRPTITFTEVTYNYPKYTRMKRRTERLQGRSIVALAGTKIKLKIHSNVDLAKISATTEEGDIRLRVSRRNPREAVAHIILNRNQKLNMQLISTEQVTSKHETPYTLRAIADNTPSISILNDMDGKSFYLTDTLDIRYRAQDDLGLSGIYVQAAPGASRASENRVIIDLDLEKYGAPLIEGRTQIPIVDLYKSKSKFLKLSLLAKDTRDQDGLSRVITIRIASDSFDRQLRGVRNTYIGVRSWQDPNRGAQNLKLLNGRIAATKSARNQITILADSLAPNVKAGDNQSRLLGQIRKSFTAAGPTSPYGSFWFYDFQNMAAGPRFRKLGEYGGIWAYLSVPPPQRRREFEAALALPNPKAELPKIAHALQKDLGMLTNVVRRVHDDYTMINRELAGYLADTHGQQISDATHADWDDENFAVNQKAGLLEIATLVESGHLTPRATIISSLRDAANSKDPRSGTIGTVKVLRDLRDQLNKDAEAAVIKRLSNPAILRNTLIAVAPQASASSLTLASGLFLACDNVGADELFLLEASARYLHYRAATPQPFKSVGAVDTNTRARQAAAFALFDALMELRANLEDMRLGITTGELPPKTPERETAWIKVRESRLRVLAAAKSYALSPAERQTADGIGRASVTFGTWMPPTSVDIKLTETCRQLEARCVKAATPVLPQVRELLKLVNADIGSRIPVLKAAVVRMEKDIAAEIMFYRTKKDGVSFGKLHELKVHLSALTMSTLKLLDFAELAMLYDAGKGEHLPVLAATYVGLGHTLEYFEVKIEGLSWTMLHGRGQAAASVSDSWRGKVAVYEKLADKIKTLKSMMNQPQALVNLAALPATMQKLQIAHPYKTEMEKARRIHEMASKLQDPTSFINASIEAGGDVSPFWEELYYRVYRLKISIGDGTTPTTIHQYAAALKKHLQVYGAKPPKTLKELPSLLDQCTQQLTDEAREDLVGLAEGILEEIQSLVVRSRRLRIPSSSDRDVWIHHLDQGNLARAKLRSTEQIDADKRLLNRTMAGLALGMEQVTPAALTWTCGTVEMNRRKAGLTLSRVGLGGVSLSGDTVSVNLPKHIYLELKRAREGAMPPLFRDRCYEYLNEVLKKARE